MPKSPSQPGRVIAHVDMDAFYASVEVHDDQTLRGVPLVVGGPAEKRGVVAAASYEAREFGIHSAMPMARAVALCPDLVRISPRMSRYREVSAMIMGLLRTFSPLVEPLSLDEAFVDLTGTERTLGTPEEAGAQIRAAIRGDTGLTASVGISPNKFLAKLASEVDKPDGLTVIQPEQAVDFVQGLPVEKIWGVGEKTAAKLHRLGMHQTRDIAKAEPSLLRRNFGLMGLRLHELAWGRDERPVVPETDAKSVSHEITFAKNQRSLDMLLGVLTGLCQQVARRLRQSSTVGRTINVKIRYGDFNTITRQDVSGHPTDDAGEIYELASRLLGSEREIDDRPVRLLGVAVTGLLPRAQLNLDLFGESGSRPEGTSVGTGDGGTVRRTALNDALDRLEDRFGPDTVTRARSVSPTADEETS
jgi:DNA polymerase-4